MVRDPLSGDDSPDLQSVLDALDDADCRTIIRHLDEPKTATEVSEECDIPMSTTYRKLDLLTDASLLVEGTEIRPDGHHATRYELDFETVSLGLTETNDHRPALAEGLPPDGRDRPAGAHRRLRTDNAGSDRRRRRPPVHVALAGPVGRHRERAHLRRLRGHRLLAVRRVISTPRTAGRRRRFRGQRRSPRGSRQPAPRGRGPSP